MRRFQITEAEYKSIKAKEAETKDKSISRRLNVLMLRYEGKRLEEIADILSLHKGSVTAMCRRYREQGLEEYARNKYQSHRWLLSWEREEGILNQFKNEAGKQATANEIKAALDKACGKDTGQVYVYNVLKRHGWRKKTPRSRHPKAANEEACEASKKLRPVCWMADPKVETEQSDRCLKTKRALGGLTNPSAAGVLKANVLRCRVTTYGNIAMRLDQ